MPIGIRTALMTFNLDLLAGARKFALIAGHTVDLLPQDAPVPADDDFGGVIADLESIGRQPLKRNAFLSKLEQVAKRFPVVALDRGLTYPESARLRAAGIRWLPVLKARAFEMLINHPLAPVALADCEPGAVTVGE